MNVIGKHIKHAQLNKCARKCEHSRSEHYFIIAGIYMFTILTKMAQKLSLILERNRLV